MLRYIELVTIELRINNLIFFSDSGMLSQELCQSQFRRPAHSPRMHEAPSSLYQLPPQIRRAIGRCRRWLRRQSLPDAQPRFHGRLINGGLLLPTFDALARPQPGRREGDTTAPPPMLHRKSFRRRGVHFGERRLHVYVRRFGGQSIVDQRRFWSADGSAD